MEQGGGTRAAEYWVEEGHARRNTKAKCDTVPASRRRLLLKS